MAIFIDDRQSKLDDIQELSGIFEKSITKVLELNNVNYPVEVSVLLVDNEEIRELNNEYRGKDVETDVLSFPMIDFNDFDDMDLCFKEALDPVTNEVLLGDIVVSIDKIIEQANEYGHSIEREAGFLIVHGTLHLLGYDHEVEEERLIMREHEEKALKELGLDRN